MQLFLYNSLTKQKEIFTPINKDLVKLYVCGPTVYDFPHIGNARSVVVFDILYRILIHIFGNEKVLYVRNITDVDDKIIDRAKEKGIKISDLTNNVTEEFHNDMRYLGCLTPNIEPKATAHINDMIWIIQRLLDNGFAYIANNHVYYDVSKAKNYTKLSGRELDDMIHNVRIEKSEHKNNPGDFVLWKPTDTCDDSCFKSPWGLGRPGWHIECSAMSYKYLGENFDIHGGGVDLIFPHHTNEIAQSTSAFPGSYFAKYWVHNGFLTVNGDKMSKSLGNFITIKDLINKNISGDVIRLLLINTHYRKPLDFNEKAVHDAKKTLNYWYKAIEDLKTPLNLEFPQEFITALLDDMNVSTAIKIINDFAKNVHTSNDENEKLKSGSKILQCANFLGLMRKSVSQWFTGDVSLEMVETLLNQRNKARLEKNWPLSDQIRKQLLDMGITIKDQKDGSSSWYKN